MFSNLRTALYQKGISMKQYAEFLGVGELMPKPMTNFRFDRFFTRAMTKNTAKMAIAIINKYESKETIFSHFFAQLYHNATNK